MQRRSGLYPELENAVLFQKMMGICLPLLVVTTVAGVPSEFMHEIVEASVELACADDGIIAPTDSKAKEIALIKASRLGEKITAARVIL